ncbi:tetratricopeptide repeat protein [Microbacterium hibisci]|uniref:tetratricopeptide repeat protein n=1 Tax=Microbacterium hibisci TaxID=2036000 RepID=UPI0027D9E72C|nr:tetratricopeptide repeat protein [Microbacterium hibisci]
MTDEANWTARVEAFWATFDDSDPAGMLAKMRALVDQRAPGDARALAEWGGVHDALGLEEEAVEPYRRALATGLDAVEEHQVTLQLASTLRNLGQHEQAIALLEGLDAPELGGAPAAFLALALHSAGRADEALEVALTALAPHLPLYNRAVLAYAAELTDQD